MKKLFTILLLGFFLTVSSFGQWHHKHYVDNFGDKTNLDYISFITTTGCFSNSATNNSNLTTQIVISQVTIDFYLYEYSSGPAIGESIGNCTYTLFVKIEESDRLLFSKVTPRTGSYKLLAPSNNLFMIGTEGLAEIECFGFPNFLDILKKSNKPIKCYIVISSEYSIIDQTYNFTINPIGFTKAYKKLTII